MRVALIHDWLVTYRGGEKVLEALSSLYPEAPIFTLFYDEKNMPDSIRTRSIVFPKGLNRLRRFRKNLLPILPAMIESFPVFDYDLIISSSSCIAKGIIPAPFSKHLCFLHSPMRYVWDQKDHYVKELGGFPGKKFLFDILTTRLRNWDVSSSHRVDRFVANSTFVAKRVQRYYSRQAAVIHPPVELNRFQHKLPDKKKIQELKDSYFLTAGALVPYKRVDLAIAACETLGYKLIIAGSGPDEKKLRAQAGKHTEFVISPSNEKWVELLTNAKALIFPGVEDFGITPIEALACGTPIIALKKGGALDFVHDTPSDKVPTGEFFEGGCEQLIETLKVFDRSKFNPESLRNFAKGFSRESFLEKIKSEISYMLKN